MHRLSHPNLQSRRQLPVWLSSTGSSKHRARVAAIIETEASAKALSVSRMKRLSKRAPALVAELAACPDTHGGCRKPNCASCARSFRLWRSAETESLIVKWRGRHDPSLVTLIFREVAVGQLATLDLKSEIAKLRVDLSRSIGRRLLLIGGIEVAWREGGWSLHVHAVTFGPVRELRAGLASTFNGRAKRAVVIQRLKDLEQVTYAGKFADTFKPPSSAKRKRHFPLPNDQMLELHCWWARYTLRDFLFLYSAKIQSGKIWPTLSKTRRAGISRPDISARTHRPTRPRK